MKKTKSTTKTPLVEETISLKDNPFLNNGYFVEQRSRVQYVDPDTGNIEESFDIFPSLEHAFQCQKTKNRDLQDNIRISLDINEVHKLAKEAKIPDNWVNNRVDVMRRLLEDKFQQHLDLKILLLNTADKKIVNENSEDKFWGVDKNGDGDNMLGVLLTEMRERIMDDEGTATEVFKQFLIKNGLGSIIDVVLK